MTPTRRRPPPLLPSARDTDWPLFVVVAILATLACAAAIGARATWSATGAWSSELAAALTIQVRSTPRLSAQAAAAEAADIASALPGVDAARPLTRAESERLLAPWFGDDGLPADIPLPGLVDVRLSAEQPATAADLEAALRARDIAASVDDHARWAGPLRRVTQAARGLALVIVVLLGAAAAAVVSYAVRASLVARQDVIEVLHMAGAPDRFIAGEFMTRFSALGARAGLAGAVVATIIAGALSLATDVGTAAQEYLPRFQLNGVDIAILIAAPAITAGVAALTARRTVLQALQRIL